ncbi:unnamed protein product [Kluyveromyces dobzhanskii CBS 2104]|uniref:WGS project CCBQ000000000 data, contig MAT n=1 Tax=Kluyveromyces dobzhanskii CBS 2104 TaxID=1427455 RepID=A0A0A8L3U6_9SACH|nr:unnamed protein product [Kluyveromyces dobzhanskii CBS 2104]
MSLLYAKEKKLDLYRNLGINIDDSSSLNTVTPSLINKQFRRLSLSLHPDKSNEPDSEVKQIQWDHLQLSQNILLNHKKEYDNWYQRAFLRGNKELLYKLQAVKKGNKANPVSYHELEAIKEHGQSLRKLLHFKMHVSNWQDPTFEIETNESNKNYETCLFRVTLVKREQYMVENELNKWFLKIDIPVTVKYYSENNRQRDDDLVVYVSARNVQTVINILRSLLSEGQLHPDILEFDSAVNYKYFAFKHNVELDSGLSSLLYNSANNPITM